MNRRDFLKLAGLLSLTFPAAGKNMFASAKRPNIIVIVLDSMSAHNLSLYGYPNPTTPFLESFANVSTVYHRHYTPGTFTPSGTASLLTGKIPPSHRVTKVMARIPERLAPQNIFNLLSQDYLTVSLTQNLQAEMLLQQCKSAIDMHIPIQETAALYQQILAYPFGRDLDAAYWGERIARGENTTFRGSFFLSGLLDWIQENQIKSIEADLSKIYPDGLPHNYQGMAYVTQTVFEWLEQHMRTLPAPFFGYYHLYPPHHPYRPASAFQGIFEDHWTPPEKPEHPFALDIEEASPRIVYDEFIAEIDALLGKMLTELDAAGILDNSYVVITSDHGELFERGIWGHVTPVMYESLVQVPLLIHKPGQQQREDVETATTSIDLLPTLCSIAGVSIPDWAEGAVLPGFDGAQADPQRSIFMTDFKQNRPRGAYDSGTIALLKGHYKLIYYFGYRTIEDGFEFYDLENDPEELNDLYPAGGAVVEEIKAELLAAAEEMTAPFDH